MNNHGLSADDLAALATMDMEYEDSDLETRYRSSSPELDAVTSEPWDYGPHWADLEEYPEFNTRKGKQLVRRIYAFCERVFGHQPYEWQARAAAAILLGQDVMVNAATGDGKSLVFQLLAVNKATTLIVITPLIGLMQQHCDFMNERGIAACQLTKESETDNPNLWKEIDQGKYRIIFASPEKLFDPEKSRSFRSRLQGWQSHKFLGKIVAFVLDEAHMVWKWGESGYRPQYKKIGDIRPFFRKIPFLLLSATVTGSVREYLHKVLRLNTPSLLLRRSCARPNIRLLFARAHAPVGDFADLDFLVPTPNIETAEEIPKTLLYVDSKPVAASIIRYLRKRLPHGVYDPETTILSYTGSNETTTRNENMEAFKDGSGRVMVCTEAAGMGMDIGHVDMVIQYRIPQHLTPADLWQRLGRCARKKESRGLGVVLVDSKFIFSFGEFEAADLEGRYRYEVGVDKKRVELKQFVHNLYTDEKADRQSIDPGLLWLINTHGCRHRTFLALFDDPSTYGKFDQEDLCDSCSFSERSKCNRRLPPVELQKKTKKSVDDNGGIRNEQLALDMENERILATVAFNSIAVQDMEDEDRGVGDFSFHFPLVATLRYEDTCAFEDEQIAAELKKRLEARARRKATEKDLILACNATISGLFDTIYTRDSIRRRYGMSRAVFFSGEFLKRISRIAIIIYEANKATPHTNGIVGRPVISEFERAFAGTTVKWNSSGLLGRYMLEIVETIHSTVETYFVEQRRLMPAPQPRATGAKTTTQPTTQPTIEPQGTTSVRAPEPGPTPEPPTRRATIRLASRRSITPVSRNNSPMRSRQATPVASRIEGESEAEKRLRQGRPRKKRKYSVSPEPEENLSEERLRIQREAIEYDLAKRLCTDQNGSQTTALDRTIARVEERNAKGFRVSRTKKAKKRKADSTSTITGSPSSPSQDTPDDVNQSQFESQSDTLQTDSQQTIC